MNTCWRCCHTCEAKNSCDQHYNRYRWRLQSQTSCADVPYDTITKIESKGNINVMASKARTVICLLRNDLRLHDNEVLHWAQHNADFVVPLYCFDPRHYGGTYHFNFPKTGPFRCKFLLESVSDLRQTLQKANSGLLVRKGKPESVVSELIGRIGKENVSAVALQEEATKEEIDVEAALEKCGVPVKKIWGSTLYHRDDLPFNITQLPNVYTEFRKRVESRSRIRRTIKMPEILKPLFEGLDQGDLPKMEDLGIKVPESDNRTAFPFQGGETAALARLHYYLWESDCVASYKETRNGLISADYSTKFSSWLALGCISPRRIHQEIQKYEHERTANQSTYWVTFELIWRDYFKFVALKFGERLFYLKGLQDKEIEWSQDKTLFTAWKEGKTGVPFVDANMREVAATGFMSNRGRQNVASFLTKDLKLDWRLGAEWFEYLLIDHDVCSNYGNWLYSAGIGNDPRQDRKFNMVKQGLDYDPQGDYVRLWVPELAGIKTGDVHTPWILSKASLSHASISLGENYPSPIVMAPEWNRHVKQPGKKGKGPSRTPPKHKNRGIDFYFSSKGGKSY
ncbi:cryptochrome DASH-like [Ptychodera flava]|uniref:cryptochrome DASH-like n=1 Tax=Ptychodera flava TaxID=63121 RepID=UPI00396A2FDC